MEAPASLSSSLRGIPFVCPRCRGDLRALRDSFRCDRCERSYSILAGIPDFRIFADSYLSFEEDRDRAQKILQAAERLSFPDLLGFYWEMSDVTPPDLRKRFVETALTGSERARRLLARLDRSEHVRRRMVLEIGSGTGNLLAEAAAVFPRVIGTDIAMRWLHLSRSRLRGAGLPEPALVCCCAEALPFPDGFFQAAVSIGTLEFARDRERFLAECARVLAPAGTLLLNTVNRFSLAPEPHVALAGVGWLPRAWQARYVRWRRRASFENIHLLSYWELRRLVSPRFRSSGSFLPELDDVSLPPLSPGQRFGVWVYRLASRLPGGAPLVRRFGPEWDAVLEKPADPTAASLSREEPENALARLKRDWEDLATLDPLWAIFTRPEGKFERWNLDEFFSSGDRDINRILEVAARLGCPSQRDSALDFGCGVGRLTRALAKHFQAVEGIDISETMIAKARELHRDYPRCQFLRTAREDLRLFNDDRFDLVLSNWVLQHLPHRRSVTSYISEFVRVLRPGGLLVFQLRSRLAWTARLAPRRRLYGFCRRLGVPAGVLYRRLRLSPMRMIAVPEETIRRVLEDARARILEVERYAVASGDGVRFFVTKEVGERSASSREPAGVP